MRKLALTVGLFVLLASSSAWAVPQYLTFSGRLKTSSGPVNGSVNLTFNLFSAATGGTTVWTEVRNGVGASQGLVFLDLGQVTTLDSSYFTGPRMYLEITVGTEVLSPRVAINSVPYAFHTENSDTLGGTIGPTDVITSAAGTTGVVATKTGNALSVSLSTAGCTTGQAFKYNGTNFACANDADSAPTAGTGISVTGNTVSLITAGCTTGQAYKYNGTNFACANDADSAPTAGTGISVTGNTVSLITAGCTTGQVYKFNGTNFACANDIDTDTNTTYTGSAPITVSGTTISLSSTGCVADEVWSWSGSAWQCVPPTGISTCTYRVLTSTTSVTTLAAQCPAGKFAISGGCDAAGTASLLYTRPTYPAATDNGPITGGWYCNFSAAAIGHTTYALCCNIN